MNSHPYSHLIRYKQWADRGLYEAVAQNFGRLDAQDATILLRVLDHIHVVDRVFQHHLQGLPHAFCAPRSDVIPDIRKLSRREQRSGRLVCFLRRQSVVRASSSNTGRTSSLPAESRPA